MLNNDIAKAQRIVGRSYSNVKDGICFHNDSFIYKCTNEMISRYYNTMKNADKVLSVISSSDQVFNSILAGSTTIDCFDISNFPKYFLKLKREAILKLGKEEYINYFYGRGE